MNHIEYSALNYYHSPISDECLCVGVLFHNLSNGQRDFRYISNFKRFQSFDDEADIDFIRFYLKGIKEDVENSIFNFKKSFDIKNYIQFFANEFRFSFVKTIQLPESENYVDSLTKVYLKFDMSKSLRLNSNEEKKLIRRVLDSNNLNYSTQKTIGAFNDEISFDYELDSLCIKFFTYKGKNLKKLIASARQWSFAASELKGQKKVLFIYETDYNDKKNLDIIIKILSSNAKVLQIDDGMDYILMECS